MTGSGHNPNCRPTGLCRLWPAADIAAEMLTAGLCQEGTLGFNEILHCTLLFEGPRSHSRIHGVARIGATDLAPAVEAAVADCLKPRIARRVIAEQDVQGPVAEIITYADDGIVGVGAADLLPARKRAVADRLKPSVAGRVVAEQNVVVSGAVEVADADYGVVRVGAADLAPAVEAAVADRFNPGITR